jgi:hypothetical protein
MLLELRKKEGIVLILVLIILMVMAIFGVTIFSQSVSQNRTSRAQIDQLVGEQLAKGIFWNSYNSQVAGGAPNLTTSSVVLNGRTYNYTVTNPSGNISVDVSY